MLLASAFAILLTWAVLALVLIGLGSLVLCRLDTDFLLLDAFWLGLAVSVALLEFPQPKVCPYRLLARPAPLAGLPQRSVCAA